MLILLIRRSARLLWREKTALAMLAIPPLIALVDFVFSPTASSDPARASIVFGILVFLVLLTSGVLVQNEIFKERVAYQYENRTKTLLIPYILSKVWLVGMLAIYQALVWTIIHFVATGTAAKPQVLLLYGITLFLVAFIGGLVGLLVSAWSKNATMTTNWLLLFTVPQLILSGSIISVADLRVPFHLLAWINPAHYALEALLAIHGYVQGSPVIPLSNWFVLAIVSFCLIVLLMGFQQTAGRVRVRNRGLGV
jgi:ABC-type multidrug transport system permease subunit